MKYQSTGEVREIREGDYFLTNSDPRDSNQQHNVRWAHSGWVDALKGCGVRVIMEPVPGIGGGSYETKET